MRNNKKLHSAALALAALILFSILVLSTAVSLTASNANGASTKNTTIIVQSQSSSDGGSSNDMSGGGGGGSPEPQSNVEIKELSQTFIGSGQSIEFDFPRKVTPVVYISFDSKKTAGKTTTIAELLKRKSTLVSELPSDEVYKHLNIWVGNSGFATPENVENAVVGFKVEKSWVQDKNIDQSSITLNIYSNNKWEQLQTSQSGENNDYLFFTAKTQGFSEFAITGKTKAQETVTELQPNTGIGDIGQNKIAADVKQANVQKGKTSTSGFEITYGIIGLLGVFLCRRRL